jgi:deoxyribose-phosphate aldolase
MNTILNDLNRQFDHAALKSDVTEKDIIALCEEAVEYDLFGVAINPVWVALCRERLTGTRVHVIGVAGFPLGANRTDIKIEEAARCVSDGAQEIDMVANIGWLASDRLKEAENEICAVRRTLPFNVLLKVIVEAGMLTEKQQAEATRAVVNGCAQFVKTSTGFFGGATVEQVRVLVKAAQGECEVKASGGIRTLDDARVMLEAGATRLGSSSSGKIVKAWQDTNMHR